MRDRETFNMDCECPSCGANTNQLTGINDVKKPREGDISICFLCGSINKFNKDFTLEEVDEEFMSDLKEKNPDIHKTIMDAVIAIKSMQN